MFYFINIIACIKLIHCLREAGEGGKGESERLLSERERERDLKSYGSPIIRYTIISNVLFDLRHIIPLPFNMSTTFRH